MSELMGWLCPVCQRGIAPFVSECHCVDGSASRESAETQAALDANELDTKMPLAPLIAKVRWLATVLGIEETTSTDGMVSVIVAARSAIGAQRYELLRIEGETETLRAEQRRLCDEIETMRRNAKSHELTHEKILEQNITLKDKTYRDREKIRSLESEIKAKRNSSESS